MAKRHLNTNNTPRPLSGAQRSAALRLLEKEERRLWDEYRDEFNSGPPSFEKQAREEWFTANPDFVAVIKKAERYMQRVEKRIEELRTEAAGVSLKSPKSWRKRAPRLKRVDGGAAHFYGFVPTHYFKPGGHGSLWQDRVRELHEAWVKRQRAAHQAIVSAIEAKRTEIDLAVLGTDYDDLITLPTLHNVLMEYGVA